ncbi:MAG TPA: hypothetical protein VNV85_08260, partial [Puia sp.]|nr:hypothetical protein [Puia sp.]
MRRNFYLLLIAALLLIAGYLTSFILKSNFTDTYWRNSIQDFLQEREKDFITLTKDDSLIRDIASQQSSMDDLARLTAKKYTLLLYEKEDNVYSLKFWNTQQVLPPDSLLKMQDGNYFFSFQNGQYEFVKRKLSGGNKRITAIAIIPLRSQYYIAISGFKPEFVNFPAAENRFHITQTRTEFSVRSYFGNILFFLARKGGPNVYSNNLTSRVLILISILLLLIAVHNLAQSISENFGSAKGIAFLIFVATLFRSILYRFPGLFKLRQFELFDPKIYSSSFVLSSLGDLLINSLMLCWIVLFAKQEIGDYRFPLFRNKLKKWASIIVVLVTILFITFVFSNILRSLVADARISFSVTNFFSLTAYSFIGFIVLATLALSYFFITQILLNIISSLLDVNNFVVYIVIAFTGLLLLTFAVKDPGQVSQDVIVLIWLLIYIWLMQRKLFSSLNLRLNVSEVLFWLFIFSASISSIIFFENKRIEIDQRERTAETISEQADPSSERLFSIALAYIDNDFLYSNFRRFKAAPTNAVLKDSLINSSYSTYRTKYDMKILTYDSLEKPLY